MKRRLICLLITIIEHYWLFENLLVHLHKLKLIDMVTISKDGKDLLTTVDIITLFQVCRTTIYNWEKQGKLKPYKVGRKKFYSREEIQSLFVEMF